MKLLAKSSYGYQVMDCNRNTVTNQLNDEKTHAVVNSELFKQLNHVKNAL